MGRATKEWAVPAVIREVVPVKPTLGVAVGKWISLGATFAVGVALAAFAAWGIISSSTAAPHHNPAGAQIVDYGRR